jgi:restriction system protein
MVSAWVVRSGRLGERDQWALDHGLSGGGWKEVPDLTGCIRREDLAKIVAAAYSDAPAATRHNYSGQLWALRSRIQLGDLLVMPLKTTKQIGLGRVTSGYNLPRRRRRPRQTARRRGRLAA